MDKTIEMHIVIVPSGSTRPHVGMGLNRAQALEEVVDLVRESERLAGAPSVSVRGDGESLTLDYGKNDTNTLSLHWWKREIKVDLNIEL